MCSHKMNNINSLGICWWNTYTPIRYAFKKHIGPNRLFNMKSHDHHVMLQSVLPTSIWSLLHLGPRKKIIRLGKIFQRFCTKVLNLVNIQNLRTYMIETLHILEIWWPPVLFDLQTHLIMHLVDGLKICGPMGSRWCYLLKHYLHLLKEVCEELG